LECPEQIRAARASHAGNLIYVNDLDCLFSLEIPCAPQSDERGRRCQQPPPTPVLTPLRYIAPKIRRQVQHPCALPGSSWPRPRISIAGVGGVLRSLVALMDRFSIRQLGQCSPLQEHLLVSTFPDFHRPGFRPKGPNTPATTEGRDWGTLKLHRLKASSRPTLKRSIQSSAVVNIFLLPRGPCTRLPK
jgi:hypothetical protein